ncbi:DUF2017 family protein [Microbacterium keratanolyticum]
MSDTLMLPIAHIEARNLIDLLDQFTDLLDDPDAHADPGVQRLTPILYPDDIAASDAFAALTSDDLRGRRKTDAHAVRASLSAAVTHPLEEGHELVPVDLEIDAAGLDSWMRTLTALRLVIAERLGIQTDTDHDPDDPRFGVYDWLGYRLETLLDAAEEAGI